MQPKWRSEPGNVPGALKDWGRCQGLAGKLRRVLGAPREAGEGSVCAWGSGEAWRRSWQELRRGGEGEGAGQRGGSVPDNQPQVLLGKLAAPAAVTKQ